MLPLSTPLASALCCGRTSKFAGRAWNAPATLNPSQQQRLARRFDISLPAFQAVAVEARTHQGYGLPTFLVGDVFLIKLALPA